MEAVDAADAAAGAVEPPKKPACGAFGQFLDANRPRFVEEAKKDGLYWMPYVSRKAAVVWKTLTDAEKAPWETKYLEAQATWEEYAKSEDFVDIPRRPTKTRKRPKVQAAQGSGQPEGEPPKASPRSPRPPKVQQPPGPPKKPVFSGFGQFLKANRPRFVEEVRKESEGERFSIADVTRKASAAWNTLGDAEKAPWNAKYREQNEIWEAFVRSGGPTLPPKRRRRCDYGELLD